MTKFEEDLLELDKKILEMASNVENMIVKSMKALGENNMILAQEVIKSDEYIDHFEVEIDNLCIKILALYQPEGRDIRTVTMIMKINNDLERIGDHATSISKKALYIAEHPPIKPLLDIPRMADKAIAMLKDSIKAFIDRNPELAIEVCKMDDEVDLLEPQIIRELITYIMAEPAIVDRALRLVYISRHLERVADLATNIAEDAYYIATGNVLKHQHTSEIN